MTEIDLDESVDISRVGLLYDRLGQAFNQSSSVTLKLSSISNIDCAGIQLLYAFTQSARNQGIEIIFSQPSDTLLAAAKSVGLAGYFAAAE